MEKGGDFQAKVVKEIELCPEANLEIINPRNINVILVPESKNSMNMNQNMLNAPNMINTPIDMKSDISKKIHLEKLDMADGLAFVFVNPRSGSEEGKFIFNIVEKQNISTRGYRLLEFNINETNLAAYYFNIIDKPDYETGCNLLDDYLVHSEENTKFKVLVAGGDGTVLSVIEDLNSKGIDINRCVFGHIPLGTGNDLANALGFGCTIDIDAKTTSLHKIMAKYFSAKQGKVDIWELRLSVDKDKGAILEIKNEDKKPKMGNNGQSLSVFKRSFINYFSLGYDARVGFGFEKKRSGNRCWNKCIYFWEGCKKNCCRKTIPLNSFIHSFQVFDATQLEETYNPKENAINQNELVNNPNKEENVKIEKEVNINECFNNSEMFEKYARRKSKVYFRTQEVPPALETQGCDPVSIVAQNINFYMGGVKDIWRKSGAALGVEVLEGNKIAAPETKTLSLMLENAIQSYNDQKLEFFSYSSAIKVGFEKIATGQADKIYHGKGPILLQFKDTPEKNKSDKYNRVYMNVDGEFYHIVKPQDLRVHLNTKICGGSANFLIN